VSAKRSGAKSESKGAAAKTDASDDKPVKSAKAKK
jgi:hypothetical protein